MRLVYHATLLSHFRPSDALRLMAESHRVLKPGGVLRVVTEAPAIMTGWFSSYYDQATRDRSGGAMRDYLNQVRLPKELFIYSRIGS